MVPPCGTTARCRAPGRRASLRLAAAAPRCRLPGPGGSQAPRRVARPAATCTRHRCCAAPALALARTLPHRSRAGGRLPRRAQGVGRLPAPRRCCPAGPVGGRGATPGGAAGLQLLVRGSNKRLQSSTCSFLPRGEQRRLSSAADKDYLRLHAKVHSGSQRAAPAPAAVPYAKGARWLRSTAPRQRRLHRRRLELRQVRRDRRGRARERPPLRQARVSAKPAMAASPRAPWPASGPPGGAAVAGATSAAGGRARRAASGAHLAHARDERQGC